MSLTGHIAVLEARRLEFNTDVQSDIVAWCDGLKGTDGSVFINGDRANTGDYIVKSGDNYYKAIGMPFGLAVEAAKNGKKVARAGWNGKGMFLIYIFPYINDQYTVIEKDGIVGTLAPYIAMKTADNQLVPWLASQTDILANDWHIIE